MKSSDDCYRFPFFIYLVQLPLSDWYIFLPGPVKDGTRMIQRFVLHHSHQVSDGRASYALSEHFAKSWADLGAGDRRVLGRPVDFAINPRIIIFWDDAVPEGFGKTEDRKLWDALGQLGVGPGFWIASSRSPEHFRKGAQFFRVNILEGHGHFSKQLNLNGSRDSRRRFKSSSGVSRPGRQPWITRAPAALPSDKKIGLANGGQNALLSARSTACFA